MLNRKGFTLVEIMIVVAIIALLAAIAIPNLMRARLNANEAAAISALKTLVAAQTTYHTSNSTYAGALAILSNQTPPYIDAVLASTTKQGYVFGTGGSATTFTATATPQTYQTTGVRSFFVDQSGVIRGLDNAGAAATVAAPPIQ
ncbi:MAG: prepilin-type N-terminal cleavage/methylation domain-containing protein [Candidatus Omnitrophica bacterium]|nr:prepilin-type N-terminal cleavage/methylation domain-containing protein [Candidatus Omnitrophota bacterium]